MLERTSSGRAVWVFSTEASMFADVCKDENFVRTHHGEWLAGLEVCHSLSVFA
jgi:hypothetical protein